MRRFQSAESPTTERWYFFREVSGRWSWNRLTASGELRIKSLSSFTSRDFCVEDAKLHGYKGSEAGA
jgi:hypothetical protein